MDKNISKFYNKKKNVKSRNKESKKKNYLVSFFNKALAAFVLIITCMIIMKVSPSFKSFVENNVYKDNLSFAYINNLYNKYFGDLLPSYSTDDTGTVFNDKLTYSKHEEYKDGYKLTVSKNYLTPIIESGIVVYVGNMDGYGNCVIIEGIDGVDIWYGNIANTSVSMYDYVKKGAFLGEADGDYLYLVFEKAEGYLKFDEYIS